MEEERMMRCVLSAEDRQDEQRTFQEPLTGSYDSRKKADRKVIPGGKQTKN